MDSIRVDLGTGVDLNAAEHSTGRSAVEMTVIGNLYGAGGGAWVAPEHDSV
jgi:hypothetical protein